MGKHTKTIVWIVVVIVVVFFGWRVYKNQQQSETFKVGAALALTGDASEWGQGELQVTQMMIDDFNAKGGLNGIPIQLAIQDTKSTGEGTVDAVNELINIEQVPVILGPTWVDSFQGPNPIAEQAHVVMLTPSAALEVVDHKEQFTYLFSTFWPQAPEIQALDGFMVARKMKSLAIINDHDPFDTKLADELAADAQAKGIAMVDREQLPIDSNDFRTQIVKIKQLHPDAVFIEINNVSTLGPFMKQAKELGLSATIFSSPDAQNQDAVSKFGKYMEGLTYPFLKTPTGTLYADFVKKYQGKYNALPSTPSAVTTYNAVVALLSVLKSGARTGTEIRDALYKVDVHGIGVSDISFNSMGEIKDADFEMRMIHNGQFTTISQ